MFSGWVNFRSSVGDGEVGRGAASVLDKFPQETGLQIAVSVVDAIVQGEEYSPSAPKLASNEEVEWMMMVFAYGLRLPLSNEETIRKCIHIYQDWLSALTLAPSPRVPACVRRKPEFYARRIFEQFEGVFVPRNDLDPTRTVRVHIRLTLRVLGITQRIVNTTKLSRSTWEVILITLVRIADRLLAPPAGIYGSLAEQIGERLVKVLLGLWIQCCAQHFPAPPLWKTLKETIACWRHHRFVVEEWAGVTLLLTKNVVRYLYGTSHGSELRLSIQYEDGPPRTQACDLAPDCLVQCWFRLIHILGHPVELSKKAILASSPAFVVASSGANEPEQHVCLQRLPIIFLRAQRGIAQLVNVFLDLWSPVEGDNRSNESPDNSPGHSSVPHTMSPLSSSQLQQNISQNPCQFHPASLFAQRKNNLSSTSSSGRDAPCLPALPKRNTILHLFGDWLFQCALPDAEELRLLRRVRLRGGAAQLSSAEASSTEDFLAATYEPGRAEALATLCRIFCVNCCDERFLPVYLARFYYVVHNCLTFIPGHHRGDLLTSLLMHGTTLFCNDLDGAFVLLPSCLDALNVVLPQAQPKITCSVNIPELRRLSTLMLLSLLCVPMHFNELSIADISLDASEGHGQTRSADKPDAVIVNPVASDGSLRFSMLRGRIVNLVLSALRCEQEPDVLQMLLGAVMVLIQDAATVESAARKLKSAHSSGGSDPFPSHSTPSKEANRSGGLDVPSSGGSQTSFSDAVSGAAAMCIRTCRDTCQRFLQPNTNVHLTMSVLELMSGLVLLQLPDIDPAEWKYTVRWICEFINTLVCQPPPSHSRDLHSMIVAAYHCLLTWATCDSRLLFEEDTLRAVLDVVELGITGTKSTRKDGKEKDDDTTDGASQLRGTKVHRPVSRRVMEAAEMVLHSILEHLGAFPPPMGPGSTSSMLDEDALLAQAGRANDSSKSGELCPFRYFSVDKNTILGILPHALEPGAVLPTVTVVSRGPTGRHVWTMQLRHVSRHQQAQVQSQLLSVERPKPHQHVEPQPVPARPPWPDIVTTMPATQADRSIPDLGSILDSAGELQQARIQDLARTQSKCESEAVEANQKQSGSKQRDRPAEMKPPPVKTVFQTTRLLTSHLGFLELDYLRPLGEDGKITSDSFVPLDVNHETFRPSLGLLDWLPTRHTDTCYVFYVRPGQRTPAEIIGNKGVLAASNGAFHEFLTSLGWPVDLATHPGWKGSPSMLHNSDEPGQAPMPYFADNNTEVLFVVPSVQKRTSLVAAKLEQRADGHQPSSRQGSIRPETSTDSDQASPVADHITAPQFSTRASPDLHHFHLLSTSSAITRTTGQKPVAWQLDTNIAIVWLERFEDWASFPLKEISTMVTPLSNSSASGSRANPAKRDIQVLFVHPLKTGLYRIQRASVLPTWHMAGPLLSGMVVSRRVLGALTRQTVMNMSRRRRIVNDHYCPPHTLRKRLIEEVSSSCRQDMAVPELYASLFRGQPIEQQTKDRRTAR